MKTLKCDKTYSFVFSSSVDHSDSKAYDKADYRCYHYSYSKHCYRDRGGGIGPIRLRLIVFSIWGRRGCQSGSF